MQLPALLHILVILIMDRPVNVISNLNFNKSYLLNLVQVYFYCQRPLLARNKFTTKFESTQLLVLGYHYTAQWAIVISLSLVPSRILSK